MKKDNAEKNKKKKNQSENQIKEEVAKKYGISLADIEHVVLDNGKEFFKFYNPKTREVKMIENIDYNSGLSEQFKDIQQELSFTQGKDARNNAEAIYEYSSDNKNVELDLISIVDLKNNGLTYRRAIRSLSTVDRKKVKALIKSCEDLNLRYINIANAIAIDDENKVIDVTYDYTKNQATIRNAKVLNYQDHTEYSEQNDQSITISDNDFDKAVEQITISDDVPVVTDAEEIVISGEKIDVQKVITCYEMPEAVEKLDLTPKQKYIYHGLVAALGRRLASKRMTKQHQKVLNLRDNHRNAA